MANETKIVITAATEQADRALRTLGDSLDSVSKQMISFSGIAGTLAGALSVAAITGYIKEASLLQARYETLGVSMKIVGNNSGYTADQMNSAAEGMQKAGISMIESRQQALRLVQAHIDLSNANKLARIAQDAAVIGNMNSSEAFANMIHGIQTGQTDVLRTIGLNVSMEQSYAAYAATLGKTSTSLTQTEKTQAVLNSVMKEGEGIAGTYEAALGTAGKQLNSMTRYQENYKVILGETFNEALTVSVMAFTAHLKDSNGQISEMSQNGQLKKWGSDITDVLAFIADSVMGAAAGFRLLGNAIGYAAASGAAIAHFDQAGFDAIQKANDAETQSILKSTSLFRDSLAERRAAIEADAQTHLQRTKEFAEQEKRINLEYADKTARERNTILLAISKSMGAEYANKFPVYQDPVATKPTKTDPNDTALKNLRAEQFRKEAELAGNTAAQIKLLEMARDGATAKQLTAANTAQIQIDILDKELKDRKDLQKLVEDSAKGGAIVNTLTQEFGIDINKKNRTLNDAMMSATDKQHADNLDAVSVRAGRAREELAKLAMTEEARTLLLNLVNEAETNQQQKLEELRLQVEKNNSSWEYGAKVALRNYLDEISNVAKQSESLFTKAFKGMEDALVKFVRTGKLDFASLADNIINDLIRIQIQQSITQPLSAAMNSGGGIANMFSSFFGGGGGASASGVDASLNLPGAMISANGNAFDIGGVHAFKDGGAFTNGIFNTPTPFKFASGGSFANGIMGEAGPEAIMPLTRGANGKLGVVAQGAGGAQVTLQVNVVNNASQQVTATAQQNSSGGFDLIIEQIESKIANNVSRGTGSLSNVMSQTFGLNRAAGALR